MTEQIPPLRDLPPGRLAARRARLLAEITAPPPPPPRRAARRWLALGGALAALAGGVLGGRLLLASPESRPRLDRHVSGLCASVLLYDGHRYLGNSTSRVPTPVRSLGTAEVPGCIDTITNGQAPPRPPSTTVEIDAVEGVSPELAVVEHGETETLYVRDDVDFGRAPAALNRLLDPFVCSPADGTVSLTGHWVGAEEPDHGGLKDLDPPFNIWLQHVRGTPARYEQVVDVWIRIPSELGHPITEQESTPGTVAVTAECRGKLLVATSFRYLHSG